MSIGKTPKEIVSFIANEKVEIVDLRFMDFPGLWQHFSIPARELTEDVFEKGLGFDGSSIRGWQAINESDMLVKPVADTAFVDPFLSAKTLVVVCNICDPLTGEDYTRDPRNIARKAEAFLKGTGLADTPFFGPEAEFFIFDDIRYDQNEHEGYFHIDSAEGRWNTGRQENPNLGYKIRYKEGYFPVRRTTHCRTSGARCSSPWSRSTSPSRRSTTRWPRVVSARSTCASTRCSPWRTTC
jgi:glutamine synthetase